MGPTKLITDRHFLCEELFFKYRYRIVLPEKDQARKKSTKINFLGPETAWWGGAVFHAKGWWPKSLRPPLESLPSLGFEERNLGCPGNFAGMSRGPGVQKVCAKKSSRASFVPWNKFPLRQICGNVSSKSLITDTDSLLNFNLFPLQIQISGSKRMNSVSMSATTVSDLKETKRDLVIEEVTLRSFLFAQVTGVTSLIFILLSLFSQINVFFFLVVAALVSTSAGAR